MVADSSVPPPSVISSITPVPAVPLPIILLVAIDVVRVRSALRSPPPDRGAVVFIALTSATTLASLTAVSSCALVNEPSTVAFEPAAAVIAPVRAARCNRGVASTYVSDASTIAPAASCAASVKSLIVVEICVPVWLALALSVAWK